MAVRSERVREIESAEPAAGRRPTRPVPAPFSLRTVSGVLALQRAVGNRNVCRLLDAPALQRKLRVGPAGDGFEREADRVADQVMRYRASMAGHDLDIGADTPEDERVMPTGSSHVRRAPAGDEAVGLGGGPVGLESERAIRSARGGGCALPPTVQGSMEQAFGADLRSVRVHTDRTADALNSVMQSRAFTTGPDIFFARGQYQPHSPPGQRLLAHELTHTLQQGGSSHLQRFVDPKAFAKLAGEPSRKALLDESTYVQILAQLEAYVVGGNNNKVLSELVRLSEDWLTAHGGSTVRGKYIAGLRDEARVRLNARDENEVQTNLAGVTFAPSVGVTEQAERERTADAPDWKNSGLSATPADNYIFTIAVAVQFDEQLDFALERAQSTARSRLRGLATKTPLFGIRGSKKRGEGDKVIKRGLFKLAAPKTQEEIKKKAARETLAKKGEQDIDDAKIGEVAARSNQVGHTWVKLKKMVGGELKEIYSYGMWPEQGYGHPERAVPGVVKHPDLVHEKAGNEKRLFLDTPVPVKRFNAGIELAAKRVKEKPAYTLVDYNCTAFAAEIAKAVGVAFPKAATVFPAGPTKGFYQHVMSPNRLFTSMEEMKEGEGKLSKSSDDYLKFAKEEEEEEARQESLAVASTEEELSALPEHRVKIKTLFWPGERFGDLDPIRFEEGNNDLGRVWSMNETSTQYDADLNRRVEYTKVKVKQGSSIVIGWIHADDIEPVQN